MKSALKAFLEESIADSMTESVAGSLKASVARAAKASREEKSRRLSDAEYRAKKGLTTLHVAIMTESWTMIGLLGEEAFKDIDAVDSKGRSALYHATAKRAAPASVVEKLLKAGADPLLLSTKPGRKFCPLSLAVFGGELAAADRLWNAAVLKHGDDALCRQRLLRVPDLEVDLSSSDPEQKIASLRGAFHAQKDIYLPHYLSHSNSGLTSVVWLVRKLGVESLFAAYPEDRAAVFSPFVGAVEYGAPLIASHLVRAWKDTGKPFPPSFGLRVVVKPGGRTPLHLAAKREDLALLSLLLDLGLDPNVARTDGRTPLSIAAEKGRPVSAKLLLVHGADPCALVDGKPIHEQPRFVQKLTPSGLRYLKSLVAATPQ